MRGARVAAVPRHLAGCRTVLLHQWGHDPTLHTVAQLLPALNAQLRTAPVLVVAHTLESCGADAAVADPPTLDVPLPLDDAALDAALEGVAPASAAPALAATLRTLAEHIPFCKSCCGYVRLTNIGVAHASAPNAEDSEDDLDAEGDDDSTPNAEDSEAAGWVVDHVAFGVPLFSPRLNETVCRLTVEHQLLTPDAVAHAQTDAAALAADVAAFVAQANGTTVAPETDSEVPWPTRNIYFHNGELQFLPPSL